jgi:DNA invertase Pin-like site-specific DNA recombinase
MGQKPAWNGHFLAFLPLGVPTMAAKTRVALYLRVSTTDQTIANQRRELQAAAKRHGWKVVAEFTDDGISGSNGRERRPGFNNLLKAISRKEFDMVASWSVDRLSRSLEHLAGFLNELHAKGVDLYLHRQGLDTSTPHGKAMFQMMGVFAELERTIITERINAGIARAKAAGVHCGRPRVGADMEQRIRELLKANVGILRTAKLCGCGASVVQRVKASLT